MYTFSMPNIEKQRTPISEYERKIWQAEDLEARANDHDVSASRLRGTCFLGEMSPTEGERLKAMELRDHANLIRLQAQRMHKSSRRVSSAPRWPDRPKPFRFRFRSIEEAQ